MILIPPNTPTPFRPVISTLILLCCPQNYINVLLWRFPQISLIMPPFPVRTLTRIFSLWYLPRERGKSLLGPEQCFSKWLKMYESVYQVIWGNAPCREALVLKSRIKPPLHHSLHPESSVPLPRNCFYPKFFNCSNYDSGLKRSKVLRCLPAHPHLCCLFFTSVACAGPRILSYCPCACNREDNDLLRTTWAEKRALSENALPAYPHLGL